MNYIDEAIRTKSDKFYPEKVDRQYLVGALSLAITAIQALDNVKKSLFYGRETEAFFVASSSAPANTCAEYFPGAGNSDYVDIIHGIIGKATEAGELLEALATHLHKRESLDLVNLAEEVGDGQWYDAILCRALGVTFESVQFKNIAKLRARFPEKFTEDKANVRDLDTERAILEDKDGEYITVPDGVTDTAKLYATTDAAVWASEFVKVAERNGQTLDEGWVAGWFANAIETAKILGTSDKGR